MESRFFVIDHCLLGMSVINIALGHVIDHFPLGMSVFCLGEILTRTQCFRKILVRFLHDSANEQEHLSSRNSG